jgi:hypothetical protein
MLHIIPKFRHGLAHYSNISGLPDTSMAYSLNMVFNDLENGRTPTEHMIKGILEKLVVSYPDLKNGSAYKVLHPFDAGRLLVTVVIDELWAVACPADILKETLYCRTTRGESIGLDITEVEHNLDPAKEITFEDLFNLNFAASVVAPGHMRFGAKVLQGLSPYFLIKLPRFNHDGRRIQNPMSFPMGVTFRDFIIAPGDLQYNYELVGIGLHTDGDSVATGNHKMLTKQSNGNWYTMNNLNVARIIKKLENRLVSKDATFVLYRAVNQAPHKYENVALPKRNGLALPPTNFPQPPVTVATTPSVTIASHTTASTKNSPPSPKSVGSGGGNSGGGSKKKDVSHEGPAQTHSSSAPKQTASNSSGACVRASFKMVAIVLSGWAIYIKL